VKPRFVVGKVALGQVFSEYFGFPCQSSFHQFLHNHHPLSSGAELFQAVGETLRYEIHKLINSIWNKEELPDQWKECIVVPIYKKGDEADCTNYPAINFVQNYIQYQS
jgi:hypothetical protein